MVYFDFHTHRIPPSSEVIPVYNRIVYPDPAQEDSIEPGALCSCGIHPWYVLSDGVAQMERLSLLAQEPGVVAIGEAGLDRLAATPWTVQERFQEAVVAPCPVGDSWLSGWNGFGRTVGRCRFLFLVGPFSSGGGLSRVADRAFIPGDGRSVGGYSRALRKSGR